MLYSDILTMMNKQIICILGRSASGKTSIAKEVCKRLNLQIVKSYTTRKPRQSELEESDHIFINHEQVAQYNPIAYTKIGEAEYFITETELSQGDVYVVDPNGLEYLEENLPANYSLKVVYIAVDREIGTERAAERGDNPDEWIRRYNAENDQFEAFEKAIESGERKCCVVNNNSSIEAAVNKLIEVIKCES